MKKLTVLMLTIILTISCSFAKETQKMNVRIGEYTFTATLEDNQAVKELLEMIKEKPLVLELEDYSGFEKVALLENVLQEVINRPLPMKGISFFILETRL